MEIANPDSSSGQLPNGNDVTPEENLETVSCCLIFITISVGVSRVHFRAALVHGDATVAGEACSLTSPEDVDPMAWAILATKCKTFCLS